MRVLFALNNDNISNSIIKKYQRDYKEVLSYKNVYYFNAIIKELQKDKNYDVVVINEDLEPFASNDYETIDKFIFEKLDKISDEASNTRGEDIPIVLICSDRRNKSDDILVRFFGLGIYNGLLGKDRQIDQVCKLINQPRTKKEAKVYYKIESYEVSYQSEKENSVDETEVQNILAHYKRLGKDEEKYVSSFNTIAEQYTDAQLKVIIRYLPMNVKAVLEEKSPKYQSLATFGVDSLKKKDKSKQKSKNKIDVKMLEDESTKAKIKKPIVIPENISSKKIRKIETNINGKKTSKEENNGSMFDETIDLVNDNLNNTINNTNPIEDIEEEALNVSEVVNAEKRGRGRPKKTIPDVQIPAIPVIKRGRGRPRKNAQEDDEETIDLMNLVDDEEQQELPTNDLKEEVNNSLDENNDETLDLFNIDFDENENKDVEDSIEGIDVDNNDNEEDEEAIDLFNFEGDNEKTEDVPQQSHLTNDNDQGEETIREENQEEIITTAPVMESQNAHLISQDRKVVCFVGTTKNGTSFVVNNLAELLASMKISTAILDMTKNRNAYYIYTNNKEDLRNIATDTFGNLNSGVAQGINVNKYLEVYTALPGNYEETYDVDTMIGVLSSKHDIVLVDCDFDTPKEIFARAQEIYLVQSQDVLTIQPLTAFLRDLKTKNILSQDKIRIVINKEQHLKSLSDKVLIGGISYYNDPAMAFMTELFNKDNVKFCKIPFETKNYEKYLNSLVECSISLNGYTKNLLNALQELAEMVYPLINKSKNSPAEKNNRQVFSNQVNSTLDKMKKNY